MNLSGDSWILEGEMITIKLPIEIVICLGLLFIILIILELITIGLRSYNIYLRKQIIKLRNKKR